MDNRHSNQPILVIGGTGKTGRRVAARQIEQFAKLAPSRGISRLVLPPDFMALLIDPFTRVLDGRNSQLTGGVRRALGREPFHEYAREAAATGVWAQGGGLHG